MFKIDLHCHSIYSDGLSSIEDIEERCLKQNVSAVLTDHNEIRGSVKLFERGNIITLPAIEVGTKEGLEFLLYFKRVEEIEKFYMNLIEPYRVHRFMVRMNLTIEKLLTEIKDYECYVSLAHPYGFGKKSITRQQNNKVVMQLIEETINGVEAWNGNTPKKANNKACEYRDSLLNKSLTAGSDGHYLNSICNVYTEFTNTETIKNSDQLYNALWKSDREFGVSSKINMIYTGLIIALNHTKYFFDNGQSIKRLK